MLRVENIHMGWTWRELFSVCDHLTGHYSVCGWLQLACSFIKRESEGDS